MSEREREREGKTGKGLKRASRYSEREVKWYCAVKRRNPRKTRGEKRGKKR